MAKKDKGPVNFVRAFITRYADFSIALNELADEGVRFSETLPARQQEIANLEETITTAEDQIARLEDERNRLYHSFLESQFNNDISQMQSLQSQRATLDKRLQDQSKLRDDATTRLNRVHASIQETRDRVFGVIDEWQWPDTELFLDELVKMLKEQESNVEKKLREVQLLYELPHEKQEREEAERRAKRQQEAARKAQERREREERRMVLSRLLTRESFPEPRRGQRPRRGSEGWIAEAERLGIELPADNTMPVTEAELELYRVVENEYLELRRADGLPVAEEVAEQREYRPEDFARDVYVSVMD